MWIATLRAGCGYPIDAEKCADAAQNVCSKESLNEYVRDRLSGLKESLLSLQGGASVLDSDQEALSVDDCHLLPQWLYLQGDDGAPTCHHLLKYEDLANEFHQLFESKGRPDIAQLDLATVKSNSAPCQMQVGDLSSESRDLVHEVYRKDFETFGYSAELLSRGLLQNSTLRLVGRLVALPDDTVV